MECKNAKKKIKAYLDGELPEKQAKQIASHLENCPDCSKDAALLVRTWDLLLEIPREEQIPDLCPAVLARIAEEKETHLQKIFRWLITAPISVTSASAVALGIFLGLWLGKSFLTVNIQYPPQEDPLYLEVFQDAPPNSITDAYISLATTEKGGI